MRVASHEQPRMRCFPHSLPIGQPVHSCVVDVPFGASRAFAYIDPATRDPAAGGSTISVSVSG